MAAPAAVAMPRTAFTACQAPPHAAPEAAAPDGAPVNFVYLHVHNAIREELVSLEAGVKELLSETDEGALAHKLAALKERYTFLERIYKYHSSVEDEVGGLPGCTPALSGTSLSRASMSVRSGRSGLHCHKQMA